MKKSFSFLCSVLLALLLAGALPLSAWAEPVVISGEEHYVTIVNRELETAFNVKKKVKPVAAGVTVPKDVEFTFQLLLKEPSGAEAPAAQREYTLYNKKNEPLLLFYNVSTGEYGQYTPEGYEKRVDKDALVQVARTTDGSGRFTLLEDQRAEFPDITPGTSYRVTEEPCEDSRFTQITPANGAAAVGVCPEEGVQVTFENRFDPGSPVGKFTALRLSKFAALPVGYTLPQSDLEQEFTFTVLVDEEPWEGKPYNVYSQEDNSPVRSGLTGEGGTLTLRAGQVALLGDLPKDVVYEVNEEETEGWWTLGESRRRGATGDAPTVLDYTNQRVSFAVKKEQTDNPDLLEKYADDPDGLEALRAEWAEQEFLFTLLDGEETPWAEAEYYLYDAEGNPGEEALRTSNLGQFALKAGETALFLNIPEDTDFTVRENLNKGWKQVLPEDPNGYEGTVSDSVMTYVFTNQPEDVTGQLQVSKDVVVEGQPVDDTLEFTFCLSKKEGKEWKPLPDAYYQIGQEAFRTDSEGRFILKARETAVFDRLAQYESYRVEELGSPNPETGELSMNGFRVVESNPQRVEPLTADGASLMFTNTKLELEQFSLDLQKVSAAGSPLTGAVFRVSLDKAGKQPLSFVMGVDDTWVVAPEGVTGLTELTVSDSEAAKGRLSLRELPVGTLYLTEVKAPSGYMLLSKPIELVCSPEEASWDGKPLDIQPDVNGDPVAKLRVVNRTIFDLPATGMPIPPILSVGVLVIGVAALLLYIYRIREGGQDRERHRSKTTDSEKQ